MTDNRLVVVTHACTAAPVTGYSGRFTPGDLVPRQLVYETGQLHKIRRQVEDLTTWWGDELPEAQRIEGRLYPRLLIRPADGSAWVQSLPRELRPLAACGRRLALLAVNRCKDREALQAAKGSTSDAIVRRTIDAVLQGSVTDTTPVALEMSNLSVVVVQANGDEVSLARCHADELDEELVSRCEDLAVLQRLVDTRHDWTRQAIDRIAELENPAPAMERASDPAAEQGALPELDEYPQDSEPLAAALPPVGDFAKERNVPETLEFIATVTDTAWLEELAESDKRVTVQRAALARAAELDDDGEQG